MSYLSYRSRAELLWNEAGPDEIEQALAQVERETLERAAKLVESNHNAEHRDMASDIRSLSIQVTQPKETPMAAVPGSTPEATAANVAYDIQRSSKAPCVPYDDDLKERLKNPEYAYALVQELSKPSESTQTVEQKAEEYADKQWPYSPSGRKVYDLEKKRTAYDYTAGWNAALSRAPTFHKDGNRIAFQFQLWELFQASSGASPRDRQKFMDALDRMWRWTNEQRAAESPAAEQPPKDWKEWLELAERDIKSWQDLARGKLPGLLSEWMNRDQGVPEDPEVERLLGIILKHWNGKPLRCDHCETEVSRPASSLSVDLAQILKDTLHRIAYNAINGESAKDSWIEWARETARNAERLLKDARVVAVASDEGEAK